MLVRNVYQNAVVNCYYQKMAEVTFQCPCCYAIETLVVEEGRLVNTRNWHQIKGNIYHNNCPIPSRPFAGAKVPLISDSTDMVLLKLAEKNHNNVTNIASEIGVNRITVKRWLSGKSYPNKRSREKLTHYS